MSFEEVKIMIIRLDSPDVQQERNQALVYHASYIYRAWVPASGHTSLNISFQKMQMIQKYYSTQSHMPVTGNRNIYTQSDIKLTK